MSVGDYRKACAELSSWDSPRLFDLIVKQHRKRSSSSYYVLLGRISYGGRKGRSAKRRLGL